MWARYTSDDMHVYMKDTSTDDVGPVLVLDGGWPRAQTRLFFIFVAKRCLHKTPSLGAKERSISESWEFGSLS